MKRNKNLAISLLVLILFTIIVVGLVWLINKKLNSKNNDIYNETKNNSTEKNEKDSISIDTKESSPTLDKLLQDAFSLELKGNYQDAKELIKKAIDLQPNNSKTIQIYAVLLNNMGDKQEALNQINKAISIFAGDTNYWLLKIDLEKALGMTSADIDLVYQNALEKTGGDLNIVTSYASFLGEQKRYDDAIKQWEKAIELYPQNKDTYQMEIDALKSKI